MGRVFFSATKTENSMLKRNESTNVQIDEQVRRPSRLTGKVCKFASTCDRASDQLSMNRRARQTLLTYLINHQS